MLHSFSFLVLAGCLPAFAALENNAALERAISSELTRAKKELKDEGYPGIYYGAINVLDLDDWDRWSAMGASRAEVYGSQRIVIPDIRVGSSELDNHPEAPKNDYFGTPISREDDEFALKHSLWRVFDVAYKTATADFLRKQAQRISRGKAEYDTDDFSDEQPVISTQSRPASRWDLEKLRRLEDALTEPFRRAPILLQAESHVSLRRLWNRRRDTNGTQVNKSDDFAKIEIEAALLSSDGLRESISADWLAKSPEGLPTELEMRHAGHDLLVDLLQLRVSATTSPFSAPALLDPSVSAALTFSLAQRLSGEELRNPNGAQTFRGQLGQRILDESLTLIDDPTMDNYKGRPLFGAYDYDDQGVPARRVTLIEKGVLKGFLLSRYPVKGFPRSNGHGRAPLGQIPVGTPGNLLLTTSKPKSEKELLALLRQQCVRQGKPYGLWIKNLRVAVQQQGGSGQGSIRFVARVDLVDVLSGETLRVRDLDLVGTPLVMASSLLAAGDDAKAAEINMVAPTSVISPSLLLSEAELQRSETKPEKSPLLAPPQPFKPEPGQKGEVQVMPKSGFIQVNRYFLAGVDALFESLDLEKKIIWRQTLTNDGVYIDVKIFGAKKEELTNIGKKIDRTIAALVSGGVHKTVLFNAGLLNLYRARFEEAWPDEGPR